MFIMQIAQNITTKLVNTVLYGCLHGPDGRFCYHNPYNNGCRKNFEDISNSRATQMMKKLFGLHCSRLLGRDIAMMCRFTAKLGVLFSPCFSLVIDDVGHPIPMAAYIFHHKSHNSNI